MVGGGGRTTVYPHSEIRLTHIALPPLVAHTSAMLGYQEECCYLLPQDKILMIFRAIDGFAAISYLGHFLLHNFEENKNQIKIIQIK